MAKYSINDTTLTAIGDAVRNKSGKPTRMEKQTIMVDVPAMTVSKTPNATGGFNRENTEGYCPKGHLYDVVSFPGASSISIDFLLAVHYAGIDYLQIAPGRHDATSFPADSEKYTKTTGNPELRKQITIENTDTITFHFYATYAVGFGYYAECTAFDAEGNPLVGGQVEKEIDVEVPNTLTPAQMAEEIEAIELGDKLPDEAFVITGDCRYKFGFGGWDWFINGYGDKITTQNITNAQNMFNGSKVSKIPFELNFNKDNYTNCSNLFTACSNAKEIADLNDFYPEEMNSMFSYCSNLRYLPKINNFNNSRISTYNYSNISSIFSDCGSLRSIPEDLLKQLYNPNHTGYSYCQCNSAFSSCHALDEVRGLMPITGTITSNVFTYTFTQCHRLKNIIFAVQEDGTPYSAKWKSQTIDLATKKTGYVETSGDTNNVIKYNSGITRDKLVSTDELYAALKDDPDWFGNLDYARYNRTSAVNTINSLPDTSAYLATAGGTNTIKFKGAAGAKTDGGAINTMTEEEIAVAAAKGWTVSFA